MNNKQQVEQLTEATLNSINKMQLVEANEFLHAKIINRMQVNEQRERVTYSRLMIKLSVALGIFLCINGVSFYLLQQHQNKNYKTASGATALAQEYSLQQNSYSY